MNRTAVEKLLEHLKEQQKTKAAARFNMKFFGAVAYNPHIEDMLVFPECGTQSCLGGEAVLANGIGFIPEGGGIALFGESSDRAWGNDIEYAARKVLDLSPAEGDRLFFFREWTDEEINGWPSKFEKAYYEADTPSARLQVAIERVQHFLDTEGRE